MNSNRLLAALCGAVVLAYACGVFAETVSSTLPVTTFDASPLWTGVVLPILTGVTPAIAAYIAWRVGQWLHISSADTLRAGLETSMTMGLQLAQAKLPPGHPITIDVRNALAAQAFDYTTRHATAEIAKLGYTPDRIEESVKARASALMGHVVSPAAAATMQVPPQLAA